MNIKILKKNMIFGHMMQIVNLDGLINLANAVRMLQLRLVPSSLDRFLLQHGKHRTNSTAFRNGNKSLKVKSVEN